MATAAKRGGSWSAIYEVGRTADGKRKQGWKGGFTTRKAALSHAQEKEKEIRDGDYVAPERLTVSMFMALWLESHAKLKSLRPRTIEGYWGIIDRYIGKEIGSIKLQKLSALAISTFYGKLLGKGLSSTTLLHVHRVLAQALKKAVIWRKITRSPVEGIDAPSPKRYNPRVLEFTDAATLLNALEGSEIAPIVTLTPLHRIAAW